MTNPYRAMCAELVAEIEKWQQADDEFSDAGTIRADANYDLAPRARALLAQPEPKGPTDEDVFDLSPAAQAIIDASNCAGSRIVQLHIADALRALAIRINGADAIRQDILDIADELERQ